MANQTGKLDVRIQADIKNWENAMDTYIGLTHKTVEEATFRQAKNLLFYLSRNLPTARFKRGQPVSRLSDYFEYKRDIAGMVVAKILMKRGGVFLKEGYHKQRGVIGRAYMTKGSRGRVKFAGWKKGNHNARYFTKEMAIAENAKRKRIIQSRFGFIQLLPFKALDSLKRVAESFGIKLGALKLAGDKPNKNKQGAPAMVKITKGDGRLDMTIISDYEFKSQRTIFGKSMNQTAEWYDWQFKSAFPLALRATIMDIKEYCYRKLNKRTYTPEEIARYKAIAQADKLARKR